MPSLGIRLHRDYAHDWLNQLREELSLHRVGSEPNQALEESEVGTQEHLACKDIRLGSPWCLRLQHLLIFFWRIHGGDILPQACLAVEFSKLIRNGDEVLEVSYGDLKERIGALV